MTINLDPGLLWVKNRIRELSQELGRPIDCLEWPLPGDPTIAGAFIAGTIPLRIWRDGEFQIIDFPTSPSFNSRLSDFNLADLTLSERGREAVKQYTGTGR